MRKLTNLESIVQLHDGLAGLYFYSEFVVFLFRQFLVIGQIALTKNILMPHRRHRLPNTNLIRYFTSNQFWPSFESFKTGNLAILRTNFMSALKILSIVMKI